MLKLKNNMNIYVILIIYFFINILFLTGFPFVHSDEAWLAGLSRTIVQESDYGVTEPFFDLYPRSPHAIKVIFNTIQILFFKIMGYQIFTFRLISLLFAVVALYFFHKVAYFLTNSDLISLFGTILLALDIQFIYTSHLARQEIILIAIFLAALYYFLIKVLKTNNKKNNLFLGIIIVFAIGIHPNSFIIFLPFVFIYLYYILFTNKLTFYDFFVFIFTISLGALGFVLLSLYFDPDFIANYSSYGETLGVFDSFAAKFDGLDYFYQKLFYQVSGTYFTPDIRLQFYLFGIILLYSLIKSFLKKDSISHILLLSFMAVNLGYILIGRFNQTSIIFIFPIIYLLLINILANIEINYTKTFIIALILIIAMNSMMVIYNNSYFNYDDYINEISLQVDKDDIVLANLNSQFYFDYNKLYDYRNLAYLTKNKLTFSQYIEKNNIEYIIYPEEIDFIYNSRPKWNDLYGNIYLYYADLQRFLDEECRLVHKFTNKTYGMRIVRYIGEEDWKVKIYKVKAE